MPHSDGSPRFDGLDDVRKALSEKILENNGLVPPGTSKEEAEAAEEFLNSPENIPHVMGTAALIEVAFALGLICEACAFRRGVAYGVLLAQKNQSQDKLDFKAIMDALNKANSGGEE